MTIRSVNDFSVRYKLSSQGYFERERLHILQYQLSKARPSFDHNIIACNFTCFAASDVKGRQIATGDRASCP